MKSYWEEYRAKARISPKRIVFAEGEDPRVLQAAHTLHKEGLAQIVLLGSKDVIAQKAKSLQIGVDPFQIVDPNRDPRADRFAQTYFELRKAKGLSLEEAKKQMADPLLFGCMMVREGEADGFLGGAVRTTADTVRAAFASIGLSPEASTLFGLFFVEVPQPHPYGGTYIFADCAVTPEPSSRQLAHVALASAQAYRRFTGETPRVALLSFSTAGSALLPPVETVRKAVELARAKDSGLLVDGDLQADSALDAEVAKRKGADASRGVAGRANVLIFPDLNSGNISYKLVQRLAGARCAGPLLWGLDKPANDLSRGSDVREIVDTAVLTVLQAQETAAPSAKG